MKIETINEGFFPRWLAIMETKKDEEFINEIQEESNKYWFKYYK